MGAKYAYGIDDKELLRALGTGSTPIFEKLDKRHH